MFKRITAVGLMVVLAIVVGGCTSLLPVNSGLEKGGNSKALQAGPIGNPKTLNERLAELAAIVPAFGGMFIDQDRKLNIYLTDLNPSVAEAAKAAIAAVFGPERIPPEGVQTLQAQYRFSQLITWYRLMSVNVLAIPGVAFTGIDHIRNRLAVGAENQGVALRVKQELIRLAIPLEAVIIEEASPAEDMTHTLRSYIRPLQGGIQISSFASFGAVKICTLGPIAIRAGVRGFLVNSHCTKYRAALDSTIQYQPTITSANRVGVETFDPA